MTYLLSVDSPQMKFDIVKYLIISFKIFNTLWIKWKMQESKIKDEIPSLAYTIQSCMKILAQVDFQDLLQIYELSKI